MSFSSCCPGLTSSLTVLTLPLSWPAIRGLMFLKMSLRTPSSVISGLHLWHNEWYIKEKSLTVPLNPCPYSFCQLVLVILRQKKLHGTFPESLPGVSIKIPPVSRCTMEDVYHPGLPPNSHIKHARGEATHTMPYLKTD